jgi:SAM-dependent methyltransferase
MNTRKNASIQDFFSDLSKVRDRDFSTNAVLGYEQEARQAAIVRLLDSHYPDVLDAGCGNGRDFSLLLSHSDRLTGIDFSAGMIEEAKSRVQKLFIAKNMRVIQGDITQLDFPDGSFDLIVCSEVLEHIPDWKRALREFYRVLRPDGQLIVTTPNILSLYGLIRYPARAILGSKHPFDQWKTCFILNKAFREAGFRVLKTRGACYLIGDLSYYQPFRAIITLCLGMIRFTERILTRLWPFKYFGYNIAVKGKKL